MTASTAIPTCALLLAELKSKGSDKTCRTYERHGVPAGRSYGVSVAELKLIAKRIKGQQALALELFATGNFDAMYLAGMVANGAKMSAAELRSWADATASLNMISEYTVPWVAVESPLGREMALEWIDSPKDHVAASGWCTYAGLVTTKADEALDLAEVQSLLERVVAQVHRAPNRARNTMNHFVISVGGYVKPLSAMAKVAARKIGVVSVDMGDTACKVPLAEAYIEKMEAIGRAGVKRKTIRC